MNAKSAPDEATEGSGGVRSARRALEIVSLLSESSPSLTTKEAVDQTGLPRTTVLRLLDTLEGAGLLWATENNRYIAGPSLLRWGAMANNAWQIPITTRQAMRDLADKSGETVSIYVRHDIHRVCIAAEQGTQALRHVARVGSEQPLWAGAPARVLLSGASSSLLRRVAARAKGLDGGAETLAQWRDEAEDLGYALTHGEREDGLSVIAVPVRNHAHAVIASISLAGPTTRFVDERISDYHKGLAAVAAQLEEDGFANSPWLGS